MTGALPQPTHVRFEHHEAGRLGIGERRPRLSWRYDLGDDDFEQTGVDIEVAIHRSDGTSEVSTVANSGADQILVDWPVRPLRSRERAEVRVRARQGERHGPWSAPGWVEIGLLDEEDWVAAFVGSNASEHTTGLRRPSRVRHEFSAPEGVMRARLYLTAHGLAQAEINGTRVGDEELTPGWTSYTHRLRYATFDVTELLEPGDNAIGIWLADGWWRGLVGFDGGLTDYYGSDQRALAQLEMMLPDGTVQTVVSDGAWRAGSGPILSTGLYEGEVADARLDDPGWSRAGWTEDASWSPVAVERPDASLFVAPDGPPVRCTGELNPVSVERRGPDRWLIDFGQNHSGRLRIRGAARVGDEITIRHAEVLQEDELYTRTLRAAASVDRLIVAGGEFEWEPRFTIHGYRYAEITGLTERPRVGDIVSRVLHTDMERTGWFRSSDPRVERLHENVVWSSRSNFVDLPMDCPQRDERLGWTGDIQVFAPTAAFLFDVTGMLSSWLKDLDVDQQDRGTVPFFVPYLPLGSWAEAPVDPVAVWGDAAVLTPDVLHARTGDIEVLRRQYRSARAWVEQVAQRAGDGLICEGTMQLGDWLDPAAPPDDPALATTDPALVATAYFAHSARRLGAIAESIGEPTDAAHFFALGDAVARAYADRYLDEADRLTEDTQTAHALTTVFQLWPDEESARVGAERLAELVRDANGRIATGFAGTPLISDALTLGGHDAEAYQLLLSDECPSWLYTVAMGATTTWERWDSMLPDGSVNPGEMTSFNHYAFGAVADWLHRVVAGISATEPGYRKILFAPRPGGGLTSAGATHRTPYGIAAIDWTLTDGTLDIELTVPVGTTAELQLAGRPATPLAPGHHRLRGLPFS